MTFDFLYPWLRSLLRAMLDSGALTSKALTATDWSPLLSRLDYWHRLTSDNNNGWKRPPLGIPANANCVPLVI